MNEIPARYQRNMNTYSPVEQAALLRAKALVVGLGGLGGHVLEILVRAGLGRLAICDPDVFEESNLNRQILATSSSLGRNKGAVARERAREINPAVEIEILEGRFATDSRIPEGTGLLADCLGGLDDREALVLAARRANIPLVSAAVAGQAGWVGTVLPGSPAPAEAMGLTDGHAAGQELVLGTPAPAVVLAASLQAAEILALACGRKPALAGKVLLFDLERMDFETVSLG